MHTQVRTHQAHSTISVNSACVFRVTPAKIFISAPHRIEHFFLAEVPDDGHSTLFLKKQL